MHIDSNQIVEALRQVLDPQTGQDIIQARLAQDLKIEEKGVYFSLVLQDIDSPHKIELNEACHKAILTVYPFAEIHIHIKTATEKNVSPIPHIKNIIAVASGKGGVGKSTIAVNLAFALQKTGATVGILDADLFGPSIPAMFGLDGQKPSTKVVYGKRRYEPLVAYDMPLMSVGFLVKPAQAVVMRGPKLAGLVTNFLKEVLWPPLDYLIVDLPPGTGDIQLTLAKTVPLTGIILVTTPQKMAVIDAVKAMNMFRSPSLKVPILGVVENMSWFTPKEFPDYQYRLFGEGGGQKLATMGETHLLGQVPLIQGIREAGDSGQPVFLQKDTLLQQPFMNIAKKVLEIL